MISISNIFSDKDISKNEINKSIEPSPALNQGKKFKKYQRKIENSLEKNAEVVSGKEGFTDQDSNTLLVKTNNIINKNSYDNSNTINELREEYKKTLNEYQNLVQKISGDITGYVDRVNSNNPYLNKTIRFSTGHICYVTNQGVVKYIPSQEIWNSVNVPTNFISVNIPWSDTYFTPGTKIPTNPPLLSGTNVIKGQSFGNEGSNVFVNEFLPKGTTAKYIGCFNPSSKNDNMTFIGGSPPSLDVSIKNGNFSQSQIPNNTYRYLTWDVTTVPGWNFNCVLANNSTAWGYPMPYPNGNQCASIQTTQQLWSDWINFNTGVTYTLTFSACGRNCCDGSGKSNPINIGLEGKTFYTLDAPVGVWQKFSTTFTVDNNGGKRLSFIGTWNAGDRSTAIQNISLNTSSASNGNFTYNDCMQTAIQQGYQFFALQNVNTNTSKGYCAVSNSEPAISQFGLAKVPNKMVALWSSNTGGQPGNSAILSTTGSLKVINSSGGAIYSSPGAPNALPSNYLGCYGDNSNRAMGLYNNGNHQYNLAQCQDIANKNGYKYFGLQDSTSGITAQCALSNDLSQAIKYGKATNCTKISDGSWSGGGWSNAVYNSNVPESNYYLILEDDGNMAIYRGTSPNDNQGEIWRSQTYGKQVTANPNMAAVKGKYGKNWISSGQTLAAGDFIGSNDGKTALVMQSDGNLVLYTFDMGENCLKMNDGNIGGGLGANASYNISKMAVKTNIGKMGYIDANSNLYNYPDSNQIYNTDYSTIKGVDTMGNDIPGALFSNATVDSCKKACNQNEQCAGFILDVGGNYNKTCFPKTKSMFPFGGPISSNPSLDLYVRGKEPKTPPVGVTNKTINTDTITFQNYLNKGEIGSKYGLANINNVQKKQLEQLQTKMNLLSSQITNLTTKFQTGTSNAENQSQDNVSGISNYQVDLLKTNKDIISTAKETSGNIQNILKDSDIVVLQKNYNYLVWSILAAGTVLVSMNVIKNE